MNYCTYFNRQWYFLISFETSSFISSFFPNTFAGKKSDSIFFQLEWMEKYLHGCFWKMIITLLCEKYIIELTRSKNTYLISYRSDKIDSWTIVIQDYTNYRADASYVMRKINKSARTFFFIHYFMDKTCEM